jgi:N-methylhydantoinase A
MDEEEVLRSWKVESTPRNFEEGVLNGIKLAADELSMSEEELLGGITHFIHGTTLTTNLILTRTGERVGLITSSGFGDTYELARQYRGHEQDPAKVTHLVPLVPRQDIEEVTERIDYAGQVVAPLNEHELMEGITRLLDKGIRSVARVATRRPRRHIRGRPSGLGQRPESRYALPARSEGPIPQSGEGEHRAHG